MRRSGLQFIAIVVCLGFLLGGQASPGEGDFWQEMNGSGGGGLIGPLVVDTNGHLFSSTAQGLTRSTDDGETWTGIDNEIAAEHSRGIVIKSLAVNPSGDVFAGSLQGELFRFTYNGSSWEAASIGLVDAQFYCLSINAAGDIFAGTRNRGIFRSTDSGNTWAAANAGMEEQPVASLAINARGEVFAGSTEGLVFRSTDNGDNWTVAKTETGSVVTSLAISADGDIFAGAPFGGVMRSADNGDSWVWHAPWSSPYTRPAFASLAVNADGDVFAGTHDGPGVMRSTDDGRTWRSFETKLSGSSITQLAASPNGNLFAVTPGGIFRSRDRGESWEAPNSGLKGSNVRSLAADQSGHVFAGTYARGIFRSSNHGETWEEVNTGLTQLDISALAASPSGHMFAGAQHTGIFRSDTNGDSWTLVTSSAGAAPGSKQGLAINSSGHVFAGGYDGLFRSKDNGDTWTRLDEDSETRMNPVEALAINESGHIFAGGWRGVFRSTDNGESWTEVNTGLPAAEFKDLAINANGDIFAGTFNGLYRSTDNGQSWTPLSTGLESPRWFISSLAINASGHVFSNYPLACSTDNGDTWTQLAGGLTGSARALAIDADGYVYAGTERGGVFRSVQSTTTALSSAAAQRDQVTNDDVVRMMEAGMAAETIIAAIRSNEPYFDISVDGLLALKAAGVGDDIIRAMIASVENAEGLSPAPADPSADDFPADNGVYAVVDGHYVRLVADPIEWRKGGMFGGGITTSNGTSRTSRHARLRTLHSSLELSAVRELLLVCSSCTSAYDYHVVRAEDDEDEREFYVSFQILEDRYGTITDWAIRGGEDEKTITFTGTRLADGKFQLELPELEAGEYAVLPPDATPANSATSVLYAFRVIVP